MEMAGRTYQSQQSNPYLGLEVRIQRAYLNLEGRMGWALKTDRQTIAISADKQLLTDLAADRHMNLTHTER
jgi:hypothetical protein